MIAALGGIAALVGSLLFNWGAGDVFASNGVQKATIEVAGLDSNAIFTAPLGGLLLIAGALMFFGVPRQLFWAILAFVGGAAIVGLVVFSSIDIQDLSDRYVPVWANEGLAETGDTIEVGPDLGIWIAGAGGVLGVLAAPFVKNR